MESTNGTGKTLFEHFSKLPKMNGHTTASKPTSTEIDGETINNAFQQNNDGMTVVNDTSINDNTNDNS